MPYIKKDDRAALSIYGTRPAQPNNAGELNYLFTVIANEYINQKGEKYQHFNDVIGALEGAKLELYRRKVSPYEDTKIAENGDVY